MVGQSEEAAAYTTRHGDTNSVGHARPSGIPTAVGKARRCNSLVMWSRCYNSQTMSLFWFDTG